VQFLELCCCIAPGVDYISLELGIVEWKKDQLIDRQIISNHNRVVDGRLIDLAGCQGRQIGQTSEILVALGLTRQVVEQIAEYQRTDQEQRHQAERWLSRTRG